MCILKPPRQKFFQNFRHSSRGAEFSPYRYFPNKLMVLGALLERFLHPCDKLSRLPESLSHPSNKLSGRRESLSHPSHELSGKWESLLHHSHRLSQCEKVAMMFLIIIKYRYLRFYTRIWIKIIMQWKLIFDENLYFFFQKNLPDIIQKSPDFFRGFLF